MKLREALLDDGTGLSGVGGVERLLCQSVVSC